MKSRRGPDVEEIMTVVQVKRGLYKETMRGFLVQPSLEKGQRFWSWGVVFLARRLRILGLLI